MFKKKKSYQFCIKISDNGFLRVYLLSYRGLVAEKSVKLTIQYNLCVNETNSTIKVPMFKVSCFVFVSLLRTWPVLSTPP